MEESPSSLLIESNDSMIYLEDFAQQYDKCGPNNCFIKKSCQFFLVTVSRIIIKRNALRIRKHVTENIRNIILRVYRHQLKMLAPAKVSKKHSNF